LCFAPCSTWGSTSRVTCGQTQSVANRVTEWVADTVIPGITESVTERVTHRVTLRVLPQVLLLALPLDIRDGLYILMPNTDMQSHRREISMTKSRAIARSRPDPESPLLRQIGRKDYDREKLAARIARSPEMIQDVLKGLDTQRADVKYGCARILRDISAQHPEMLYPHFRFFAGLMDHENRILRWEGIHVLGNLARVDSQNRIDRLLNRYLKPLAGPDMITAANTIAGAALIAQAKPRLANKIAARILKVEHAEYETTECRNVVLGQATEALDLFFDHIENQQTVVEMVRRQLDNTRRSTRTKAEKFLRKRQRER
jgi:hypothetical protein